MPRGAKRGRLHPTFTDLVGARFGPLRVTEFVEPAPYGKPRGYAYWRCTCTICDSTVILRTTLLKRPGRRSCSQKCPGRRRYPEAGPMGARHPLFGVWQGMLTRCYNPKDPGFPNYGGRGITVCARWRGRTAQSFQHFLRDMGPRPPQHSLDRINNNKGYSPSNCRWATQQQQSWNSRKVIMLTHDGKRLPISEWARRCKVSRQALWARLRAGWTTQRALTTPLTRYASRDTR